MLKKRVIAALMALLLLLGTGTNITEAYAEEETNIKFVKELSRSTGMKAGESQKVSIELALKDGYSVNPQFSVLLDESSPLKVSDIKVESINSPNSSSIFWTATENIKLSYTLSANEFAKIGEYTYKITYSDSLVEDPEMDVPAPGYLTMKVSVIDEKTPPQLSIVSDAEYFCKAGETVTMSINVENKGELQAMNTYVYADYAAYDTVLLPAYTPLTQKLGNLNAGDKQTITVKYKVAEDAATQRIKLPLEFSYKMSTGEDVADNAFVYLYVEGKQATTPTPTPEPTPEPQSALLLLNSVKQSPSEPEAGEKMTVTFYLENAGNVTAKNIKVMPTGLSSAGFEPVNSEPYQYISEISAGKKQKVELTLKVGEDIPEGLNMLNVQYSYEVEGSYGVSTETESVTLYILDVQNPEESEMTISRPKLMVSNFYTDVEEVKAGNVFDFTFDILNTNDSIDAKNIKVTVTGASNAFSVTSGGNSFFVNAIKAQETAPITINLKASAAATTGAYPIQIKIEYEYEGMVATATYSGEVVEEEILLQVKENLRPSVENVYVGSWDTPMLNQPTTMSFEFYNMGKSMLNNTYVTVEGDFMLANGSNSYYIGNISAGMPEYIEFDVIPLMEGDAVGKMIIHMEDSNGDEVTMEKEFTAYVMGEMMWEDPGYMDPGYMDPGYMDPSMPVDGSVEKKPIVPLWLFLCIQGAILVIIIPVTRVIRLALYRKKIKREDAI